VLEFDEATHIYKWNGKPVNNVTTIIKEAGLSDDRFYTEESRIRGSAVHLACQYYDEGALDWDSVIEEYKPYVDAYIDFLNVAKPVWHGIELRLYNERYNYAGTLDREGLLFERNAILDLKTGAVPEWVKIQTAAYEDCIDGSYDRYALQLKSNGTYKLHGPYKSSADFKVFKAAITITNWKGNNNG